MSRDVDELFGEGGSGARPRTRLIALVLGSGLLLALLGMTCTAVPGGLITLVAWALVEKELDRVDSGYLALDYRPGLVTLRAFVWASLLLVMGLFIIQGVLLCTGWYTSFWSSMIESLRPFVLPDAPIQPTGSPPVP